MDEKYNKNRCKPKDKNGWIEYECTGFDCRYNECAPDLCPLTGKERERGILGDVVRSCRSTRAKMDAYRENGRRSNFE